MRFRTSRLCWKKKTSKKCVDCDTIWNELECCRKSADIDLLHTSFIHHTSVYLMWMWKWFKWKMSVCICLHFMRITYGKGVASWNSFPIHLDRLRLLPQQWRWAPFCYCWESFNKCNPTNNNEFSVFRAATLRFVPFTMKDDKLRVLHFFFLCTMQIELWTWQTNKLFSMMTLHILDVTPHIQPKRILIDVY